MLIAIVEAVPVVLGVSIHSVTSSANAVGTPGRIAGIAGSDEIQDRWVSNGSSFGRLPSEPSFRFDEIPEFFLLSAKGTEGSKVSSSGPMALRFSLQAKSS